MFKLITKIKINKISNSSSIKQLRYLSSSNSNINELLNKKEKYEEDSYIKKLENEQKIINNEKKEKLSDIIKNKLNNIHNEKQNK